jgi:hypothetical protein
VAAYSNQAWQVHQLSNQAWLVRQLKGLGGHLLLLVLVAQSIIGLWLTVKDDSDVLVWYVIHS